MVRKVAHTHRYAVSANGRAAITALLAARNERMKKTVNPHSFVSIRGLIFLPLRAFVSS